MQARFSRRQLARAAGAAALGCAADSSASPQATPGRIPRRPPAPRNGDFYSFPEGFVWGCATSAYQIEGAASEDGRKPSVWDTFSHTYGRTVGGATGDIASDSYHLYPQDVQLLKSLGVSAYRYSASWPRVFPDGTGQPNEKGIAFYERVTDELLANGIEPFLTLFHWDLPQALEDRFGGWLSRDTSQAFADYAAFVAQRLSGRVRHFLTTNEFSCFTDEGYYTGSKAPGRKLGMAQLFSVRHNAMLAHGMAVQAIRAASPPDTRVGLAENPIFCVPVIETPEHIQAARKAMRMYNAKFLTAILEGAYPDSYLASAASYGVQLPVADMPYIGSPLDFVGLDVYSPTYIRADSGPAGYVTVPFPSSYPRMASSWLTVGPEAAYWGPRHLAEMWNVKEIYITENGCSSDDQMTADGHVYDTDRLMYLRNYLANAHRAAAEGWPLKGYFLWSLMDNFEWADGFSQRFGLAYVDFKTLQRTIKDSGRWYAKVAAENRVTH